MYSLDRAQRAHSHSYPDRTGDTALRRPPRDPELSLGNSPGTTPRVTQLSLGYSLMRPLRGPRLSLRASSPVALPGLSLGTSPGTPDTAWGTDRLRVPKSSLGWSHRHPPITVLSRAGPGNPPATELPGQSLGYSPRRPPGPHTQSYLSLGTPQGPQTEPGETSRDPIARITQAKAQGDPRGWR